MANGAIELAKKEASARIAAANRNAKSKRLEMTLVHKGALFTSAALYGTLNRLDVPISVGGFPWKLGVLGLTYIGEAMSKGAPQAILSGVGDATAAIYIERSISRNTLIAGDDESYDDVIDDDGGEL